VDDGGRRKGGPLVQPIEAHRQHLRGKKNQVYEAREKRQRGKYIHESVLRSDQLDPRVGLGALLYAL
jgi:hypothetical protein